MPGILLLMGNCYFCSTVIDDPGTIGRSSCCPSCGKDLRVCLNCEFYETSAHWECRETIPERVADKDRSNFCDYFRFAGRHGGPSPGKRKAEQAKSDLNKLFGDE